MTRRQQSSEGLEIYKNRSDKRKSGVIEITVKIEQIRGCAECNPDAR